MLHKCASKEYSIERLHDGHHVLFRSQINARLFFRRQNNSILKQQELIFSSRANIKKRKKFSFSHDRNNINTGSLFWNKKNRIKINQFTSISGSWRKDEIEYQATYKVTCKLHTQTFGFEAFSPISLSCCFLTSWLISQNPQRGCYHVFRTVHVVKRTVIFSVTTE